MPDRALTDTESSGPCPVGPGASARIDSIASNRQALPVMVPPFDPARHELQEPPGAGFVWWTKETVKLASLAATHGQLLNGVEAARFLGVTRGLVMQMGQKGIVRRFPVGRHVFYALSDLRAWLVARGQGRVRRGRGGSPGPVYVEPDLQFSLPG